MKLVACSSCHAQYDVANVVEDKFKCNCGEVIKNESLQGIDAKTLRCGSCGAAVREDASQCEYCSTPVIHDTRNLSLICPECYARNNDDTRYCTGCGVEFHPQTIPGEGETLPCPVCASGMPPRQIGSIGVNECPDCNGIWVASENFDTLINRAIDARRRIEEQGHQPPSPTRANRKNFEKKIVYRQCPCCQKQMARRNFRQRSGIILDSCPSHGTWLDADEMELIASYIITGGKRSSVHSPSVEPTPQKPVLTDEQEKRPKYTAQTEERLAQMRKQKKQKSGEGTTRSLLEFFLELLS